MKPLKVYSYAACSTCKKALQYLDKRKVRYDLISITDQPPSLIELKQMVSYLKDQGGTFKNLFNTSGVLYREMKVADQLKAGMTESQALLLLSKHGKLIKRPFILSERSGAVGFKEGTLEGVL